MHSADYSSLNGLSLELSLQDEGRIVIHSVTPIQTIGHSSVICSTARLLSSYVS